ncbi:hypothetical protein IAG25_31190 [Caballeronia sp. EK]|uniref:hypothetical protein n=1 Tax=Caballeronia sp. EK TaxID=2767469 RepID=UPI0019B716FE|nr:hypothetical protein [Caballeronia sp. EK]MBC8641289.1 hypothetical protein [Caballeronia sp. EK]
MRSRSGPNVVMSPARLRLVSIVLIAGCFGISRAEAKLPDVRVPEELIEQVTLDSFLQQGGWSPQAEDTSAPSQLQADFVKQLVDRYTANPSAPNTVSALGLITLAESVAEWGVVPSDGLPADPAHMAWRGVGVGDGKRLMSYSKGGVGIAHADSGLLADFITYIKKRKGSSLPEAARFYALRGVNFDVLYANGGHCTKPVSVISTDLDGKPFGYKEYGYGGDKYCRKYAKGRTDSKDWQIFRHNIRLMLREKDSQVWLISNWLSRYWWPSYKRIAADPNGTIADVMINARIQNSAGGTAECAWRAAKGKADKTTAQLVAYASEDCNGNSRHEERWPFMRRPVALFEFYQHR